LIVGFSLIFQHTLAEFARLIRFLRTHRMTAHFTAGGHFPSLRPIDTMELIPGLDSIVRFEGELTMGELIIKVRAGEKIDNIAGLVFRENRQIVVNPSRPLIRDIDKLPYIYRGGHDQMIGGVNMAYMIASRGCNHNCSFCSIRQFYGSAKGKLRRVRSPELVVDEMNQLYNSRSIRFFAFRDDDFVGSSGEQRSWLAKFLAELDKKGLSGKIAWNISCRVDGFDQELLEQMKDHGLVYVSMGVESGNDQGLRMLNKRVSVGQNLAAIELLRKFDIGCSMGFMILDPSSTVNTVRENTGFLKKAGETGHFIITFCKMVPYAGTPIENLLETEGRLRGETIAPDYSFSDPVVEWFAYIFRRIFLKRNHMDNGLVRMIQSIDYQYRVYKSFESRATLNGFQKELTTLTKRANILAVETLERIMEASERFDVEHLIHDKRIIPSIAEDEWRGELLIESRLAALKRHCMKNGLFYW
jgi:anaerobic magnesium-protoporphyrin IX monomethyl ester cyclase